MTSCLPDVSSSLQDVYFGDSHGLHGSQSISSKEFSAANDLAICSDSARTTMLLSLSYGVIHGSSFSGKL